jgi:hypothetical protein
VYGIRLALKEDDVRLLSLFTDTKIVRPDTILCSRTSPIFHRHIFNDDRWSFARYIHLRANNVSLVEYTLGHDLNLNC